MDMAKQWADDVSADFAGGGLTYSLCVPLDLVEPALKSESRPLAGAAVG